MGDSNVDSSSLARKLLKIDGNPRVNLLRGSFKGNDASKPSSKPSYSAVSSNMTINPNLHDHTANGNVHVSNVLDDTANVSVHTANFDKVNTHTANVSDHTANVSAHTAGNYAYTARVDYHTATTNAYTAKGDTISDTAMSHNDKNVLKVGDTTKVDMQNAHTASVNEQKTDPARVMVDNDYMGTHVGNLDSSKVDKASDDTTNVILESNVDSEVDEVLDVDSEAELLASFKMASLDEERFLKQKSKVHWLAEGDANTKYFHNTLKCRNHRARIDVITDCNGILHEGKAVPKAFVDHYVGFLGKEEAFIISLTQELFHVRIDQAISDDMIREVTVDEIRMTMFAFADDKAPGPDGFTDAFYKKAWNIVDSGG
ncbi:hypothetical protein QVD17_30473 [Tagetes erecta]|uniref:RNA-directed DNA polymerase, eukaryota, reverse transcriptase zinc-binding domain protein n=1 Tax=Tagetes erecta TaxID=13708 RepID=A0AAD8NNF8_TARER|nr:hypothetical protein QVD17_30473 [Tagetes erecta]